MSILVTGGAGFIGSHICEKLLSEDRDIITLDNFDPYYNKEFKERNLRRLIKENDLNFIETDIRNTSEISDIFKKYDINKVLHMAARPGVRPSVEDPRPYEEINVRGTLNLLELSRRHDVNNFVFASSSSVYGKVKEIPFKEDGSTNPASPYAASKLSTEIYGRTYSQLHGLNVTALRIFTAYGPRQRPDMAINKFTRLIYKGEDVPMYGDGSSERDYTYIDDLISGITSILDKDFRFEIFNLGSGRTVKLKDMISIIENELDMEAKIRQLPMPRGDVPVTYADISKAREILDYNPHVSIEEGIQRFVSWFKEY